MNKNDINRGLIAARKVLIKHGRNASELPILKAAAEANPDATTLSALMVSARDAYEINIARDCAARLEPLFAELPEKRAWLQKAYRGTLKLPDLVETLDRPAATDPSYIPVPDRILYLAHSSLPLFSNGYSTRTHGMAMGLHQNEADVIFITRPGFPYDVFKDDTPPFEVPETSVYEDIAYHHIATPTRRTLPDPADYLRKAADVLKDNIRTLRPSVIWAASNYTTALPACIAAHEMNLPFVYEVRGFWEITRLSSQPEFENMAAYKDQVFLETRTARAAKGVLTLTTPMADELVSRGVERKRITLAPNSCDVSRFEPCTRDADLASHYNIPPNVPVIGYIGSFVQYEGLDHLAQACAELQLAGRDFRLLLVGSEAATGQTQGPLTQEIINIAAEAGMTEKLILPGRIPHEEVEAHYSLIDIAAFPRKPQPVTEIVSPLKPLEALAMTKAVLVSSVGGMAEMVQDGKTGLVFTKGDVPDLASALMRLIDDPDLRQRLGEAGRIWVEAERGWKQTAGRSLAFLHELGLLREAPKTISQIREPQELNTL